MSSGGATLWARLVRGTSRTWYDERYRSALPANLEATVMNLRADDRHHAKQGRSTGRVRFHSAAGTLSVYLKRHYRLPWLAGLWALLQPDGDHSPAAAEWAHLEQARGLGVAVPDAVAAGEWIGPWGALRSFLIVAELTGYRELNEALPALSGSLAPASFARLKRALISEMVEITAKLHRARLFHKDFYLCHFFIKMDSLEVPAKRIVLIDLHRLGQHRWAGARWRWKDLAQLLYSTFDVAGIDDRDRLRFWKQYRRRIQLRLPAWQMRIIRMKAALYRRHNR